MLVSPTNRHPARTCRPDMPGHWSRWVSCTARNLQRTTASEGAARAKANDSRHVSVATGATRKVLGIAVKPNPNVDSPMSARHPLPSAAIFTDEAIACAIGMAGTPYTQHSFFSRSLCRPSDGSSRNVLQRDSAYATLGQKVGLCSQGVRSSGTTYPHPRFALPYY
jgi:hypothetical protein